MIDLNHAIMIEYNLMIGAGNEGIIIYKYDDEENNFVFRTRY